MPKPIYEHSDILIQAMDEMTNRNYLKLIHAYLKKNNLDFSQTETYLNSYTEEQFIEKLKEFYDIKGKVDHLKIAKAKLKSDDNIPDEYTEQKEFCKWMNKNKIKHFSVPNGALLGAQNNVYYANMLKASGMKKGAPDLIVMPGNGLTLFIEMKRIKKGVVSPEQKEWQEFFQSNNYKSAICYGCNEAISYVESFLK